MSNMEYKKKNKSRRIAVTMVFILYLLFLLSAVLFLDRSVKDEYQYNLVLFDEIKRYITYREQFGSWIFLKNILGNVIGFVPLGLLWPYVFPKLKNPFFVVLICFECSLVIELIQLACKIGSFDVDDLLLNTLGGFIGCILYYVWMAIWRKVHVQKK